jgi:hypothetical protein
VACLVDGEARVDRAVVMREGAAVLVVGVLVGYSSYNDAVSLMDARVAVIRIAEREVTRYG